MGDPSKPAKSGTSTNGRLLPKLNTGVVRDFKNFVQRHNKTLNNIEGFQNIQDIYKEWFADKESWEDLKGTKWFEINKSFDVDTTKQDWMSELLDKMLEYCSEDDKKEYRKEDRKKYELAEKIMDGLEACDKEFNKIVDKKIFEENKTDKKIKINDFDGYHNKLKEHLTRLEKISIDLSKLNTKLSNNPNIKEKTLKELKICYKEMMKHVENMKIYTTDTVGKEARAKVNGGEAPSVKNIEFITSEYLIPFFKEELKYKNIISGVVNENIYDKKIRVEDVNNYTIVDKQIDWEARRIYDEIRNVIAKLPTEYLDLRDMDSSSILEKFNELIKKCNKVADKLRLKRIKQSPSDLDNDDKEGKVLYKFCFYLNSLQNFIYRALHSEVPSKVKELCNKFNEKWKLYTRVSKNEDRKSILKKIKELISDPKSELEICLEEMNGALEKLEKKPFKKIKNEKKLAEKIYKKFCKTVKDFNSFCDDLKSVDINNLSEEQIIEFDKSIMKVTGRKISSNTESEPRKKKEYLERIINDIEEFPVSKINNNDILRLIDNLKDFGEYVYNNFLAKIDEKLNRNIEMQIGNISNAYREGDEKYLESNFDIAFKAINLSIKVLSDAIDELPGSHKLNEKAHKPNEYMKKISGEIFNKYNKFTQRRENFVNDTSQKKLSPEQLRKYKETVLGEEYSPEWDGFPMQFNPPPDNYDPFLLMLDVLGFIMRYKKGLHAESIRASRADFEKRYYRAESFKDASEVVNEVYKKAVEELKKLMFTQDQLEKVSSGEMSILPIKDLVKGLKNKFKTLTKKYDKVWSSHKSFFIGEKAEYAYNEKDKYKNVNGATSDNFLSRVKEYIDTVVAPLEEKTKSKYHDKCDQILNNFSDAKDDKTKSDCLTQMYELAVRAVRHLENAIVKKEAEKYKGVLGKGKKLLKKGKKLFSKKEENKQETSEADKNANKIEKCFQNVGIYFVNGKKFTRKEMKNKIKDMKKICPQWYKTLEVYLKDNYFKSFSDDGNMPKNEDDKRKISIAVLLASLCGLPNTDYVISACDGLKKGGLRGDLKGRGSLSDAVQIRKGIKNAAVVSEGNMDRVHSYMTSLGFQKFKNLVKIKQQMKTVISVFVGLSNKDSNSSKQWKTAKRSAGEDKPKIIGQHRENKNETISIDGQGQDVTF